MEMTWFVKTKEMIACTSPKYLQSKSKQNGFLCARTENRA